MLVKVPRGWEVPEREAAPESVYYNRRAFLQAMGFVGIGALAATALATATPDLSGADQARGRTAFRSRALHRPYELDRPHPEWAASYNNFYEFTRDKQQVKDLVTSRSACTEVTGWSANPGL
jgi:sulfoxide reductase catalytic subunit YedY